jgi:mRNA interferase RelE/StbE
MERTIVFSHRAAAQFDRLPWTVQVVIEEKLVVLAMNPAALANMIKRMQGFPGQYRLRIGSYRVIFTDSGEILDLFEVSTRQGAYR